MKNKLFFVSFLSLFLSITLIAQDMPPDAAKFYNEGNKLMKAGNYDGAITQYTDALKNSKDYRIYYQLGITYKKIGKLTEAENSFQSSIQANPTFDIAYNGLGSTYFQAGKFESAAESFKKFEELTKNKSLKEQAREYIARSLVKLGEEAKKDGNYENAVKIFVDALKYDDLDAAHILLATTYYETAEYEKVFDSVDKVINMKSSILKGAAYYYKGMALKQLQDVLKAKENFELAKRDPQYKRLADYELNLLK
jgi:tetratricopeptide (TPR) repeat protein